MDETTSWGHSSDGLHYQPFLLEGVSPDRVCTLIYIFLLGLTSLIGYSSILWMLHMPDSMPPGNILGITLVADFSRVFPLFPLKSKSLQSLSKYQRWRHRPTSVRSLTTFAGVVRLHTCFKYTPAMITVCLRIAPSNTFRIGHLIGCWRYMKNGRLTLRSSFLTSSDTEMGCKSPLSFGNGSSSDPFDLPAPSSSVLWMTLANPSPASGSILGVPSTKHRIGAALPNSTTGAN